MEPTSELIYISFKEGFALIVALISYTFVIARGYFHLVNRVKTMEEKLITNKNELTDRINYLDQLATSNLNFRKELLSEVSKGYERQMGETQKVMKEWMDMNRAEHENINEALKENIKALTSLHVKFESHLSFEKGKSYKHS